MDTPPQTVTHDVVKVLLCDMNIIFIPWTTDPEKIFFVLRDRSNISKYLSNLYIYST